MATLSFSIPDEVSEAFSRAFEGMDHNAVIADLMRKAVVESELQTKREEAFRLLTERRALRPKLSTKDIRAARMENRR
jgi:hypothetical protein